MLPRGNGVDHRNYLGEGADGWVHAVSVSCGDDRPYAGGSADLVLTSHGADARSPVLCGGTGMDQQRDTDWIEPLEATTLSDDEAAES